MNGTKIRPPVPPAISVVPSLYERAARFHRDSWANGCDCLPAGDYPCVECLDEIGDLLELLDAVVRDAIRVTVEASQRIR